MGQNRYRRSNTPSSKVFSDTEEEETVKYEVETEDAKGNKRKEKFEVKRRHAKDQKTLRDALKVAAGALTGGLLSSPIMTAGAVPPVFSGFSRALVRGASISIRSAVPDIPEDDPRREGLATI